VSEKVRRVSNSLLSAAVLSDKCNQVVVQFSCCAIPLIQQRNPKPDWYLKTDLGPKKTREKRKPKKTINVF
jgi:hypothetical protein